MSERCAACRNGDAFPLDFTMAFQPIIDIDAAEIWGYEALVRGQDGAGAATVLAALDATNRYVFDQACRVKAIELAGARMPVGSRAKLSINFLPNAVYEPSACIRASLAAAARAKFDPKRLMFEFTEDEQMVDTNHVANIVSAYKRMGFMTAIDDFGAGHAGLALLAKLQPELIKIDIELVRGVSVSKPRQAIVRGIVQICRELGITVLAEGVETEAELLMLKSFGIRLFQGFLFARPQLERFQLDGEIAVLRAPDRATG